MNRNRHLAEWRFLRFTMIVTVKAPMCNVMRICLTPFRRLWLKPPRLFQTASLEGIIPVFAKNHKSRSLGKQGGGGFCRRNGIRGLPSQNSGPLGVRERTTEGSFFSIYNKVHAFQEGRVSRAGSRGRRSSRRRRILSGNPSGVRARSGDRPGRAAHPRRAS